MKQQYNTCIDKLSSRDVEKIVEIVRGLPEWFTSGAAREVESAARRLPGFVARVNGVVRGFVLLEERECCLEIAWLAVEKGFQGKGLGTLLVNTAAEYACRKRKSILTVKTYGGMDYEPYLRTLRFYKSRGFRLYEIIEDYKPFRGQPAVILIKHLDCNKE